MDQKKEFKPVEPKDLLDQTIKYFDDMRLLARGTGRSTKMYNDLVTVIKTSTSSFPKKTILVVSVTLNHANYIRKDISRMLVKENITHRSVTNLIETDYVIVDFKSTKTERSKYADWYPMLDRFVDHYVQEVLISKKLGDIKNSLHLLCSGR